MIGIDRARRILSKADMQTTVNYSEGNLSPTFRNFGVFHCLFSSFGVFEGERIRFLEILLLKSVESIEFYLEAV